jgi:hypothetical protein
MLGKILLKGAFNMATIQPKGEKIRQAIKWISCERLEDENKSLFLLIQEAAPRFNLSPKDEEFLVAFYKENKK